VISYTERALIDSIRFGPPKIRYDALKKVYELGFHSVKSYVVKNNGTFEDAKDIFQDGVTILYWDLLNDKFREEASLKTYLFSICKNMWLQKLRKQSGRILVSLDKAEDLLDKSIQDELDVNKLKNLMQELKKDCLELLTSFYYERKSMKELMEVFNLGSEQVARTKKLRCMGNLIALVKEKGLTFESFLS
jgi:RNA polymerase sigma factor (sigma-70 family)